MAEQFSGDSGPRNSAENINDILGSFMLFFDNTIIVTETNRYEQFQISEAISSISVPLLENGHLSLQVKFSLSWGNLF